MDRRGEVGRLDPARLAPGAIHALRNQRLLRPARRRYRLGRIDTGELRRDRFAEIALAIGFEDIGAAHVRYVHADQHGVADVEEAADVMRAVDAQAGLGDGAQPVLAGNGRQQHVERAQILDPPDRACGHRRDRERRLAFQARMRRVAVDVGAPLVGAGLQLRHRQLDLEHRLRRFAEPRREGFSVLDHLAVGDGVADETFQRAHQAPLKRADRALDMAFLLRRERRGFFVLDGERGEQPARGVGDEVRTVVGLDALGHAPRQDGFADQEAHRRCPRGFRHQRHHPARIDVEADIDRRAFLSVVMMSDGEASICQTSLRREAGLATRAAKRIALLKPSGLRIDSISTR